MAETIKPIVQSTTPVINDAETKDRLRQMILYISQICEEERVFDASMLNSILWFSDVTAYAQNRTPVTGATYIKHHRCPVPKDMADVKREMIAAGEIVETAHEHTPKRIIALIDADLSAFTAQQISIVDRTAQWLCGHTARKPSEATYGRAWRAAALGEAIPYSVVLVSNEPITNSDRSATEAMARKHGWQRDSV